MQELNEITFTQFHPLIWPGLVLSLVGLFLTGYYSNKKIVKIVCTSFFPIILYSHTFFYSYLASSDSAGAKAMFEIFHHVGIKPEVASYFQYPTYFSLNEITSQILGLDVKGIAIIFFVLFGILLGSYLYLFLSKMTKNISYQIAFLAVPLYFTAIYGNLNYQWVPQTLALVFFFMLLILFNQGIVGYKFLSVVTFTALVFTHAFIPIMFLLFFGFYAFKERKFGKNFILMVCIYAAVFVYYTTFFFPMVAETFKQSIYGFGGDYPSLISRSFKETSSLTNQIISLTNRIRIPLTLLVVSVGGAIWLIKKRISYTLIVLGMAGGFYLGLGIFYPILGMRSLQILFIPLVTGIGFFISKWKKPTLIFIVIILILSIFGPMRSTYDQHLFQLDEEENTCNFLVNTMTTESSNRLIIGGMNWGYFKVKYGYMNMSRSDDTYLIRLHPSDPEFYRVFNLSMKENEYVLYNPKLGKQIMSHGMKMEDVHNLIEKNLLNNKIYECGRTFIVEGKSNK